jgi:hypothetical protein
VRCGSDGFPLAACLAAAQGGNGVGSGDGSSPSCALFNYRVGCVGDAKHLNQATSHALTTLPMHR